MLLFFYGEKCGQTTFWDKMAQKWNEGTQYDPTPNLKESEAADAALSRAAHENCLLVSYEAPTSAAWFQCGKSWQNKREVTKKWQNKNQYMA